MASSQLVGKKITIDLVAIKTRIENGYHLTNDEAIFLFEMSTGHVIEKKTRCINCDGEGTITNPLIGNLFQPDRARCPNCLGTGYFTVKYRWSIKANQVGIDCLMKPSKSNPTQEWWETTPPGIMIAKPGYDLEILSDPNPDYVTAYVIPGLDCIFSYSLL